MSSFEVSTEELQGIYGGVGKICPALPQIGLILEYSGSYSLLLSTIDTAMKLHK